jgi:matrixin
LASTAAALMLATALAPAVFGWSQLFNNFPNAPTSCDNSPSWPCVAWPKNGSQSSTVIIFNDPNLTSANLNLDTDVRASVNQWHLVCAANPILQYGSGVNAQIYVQRGSLQDPSAWAETVVARSGHTIVSATTTFNTLVTWNHTFTYTPGNNHADSRKVGTHELGHAEGLGHTSFTAVMHQHAESFWTPQTNDIQGMQAVYGPC